RVPIVLGMTERTLTVGALAATTVLALVADVSCHLAQRRHQTGAERWVERGHGRPFLHASTSRAASSLVMRHRRARCGRAPRADASTPRSRAWARRSASCRS